MTMVDRGGTPFLHLALHRAFFAQTLPLCCFVRLLPLATDLRFAVVTAFLGVPFFIYLLLRRYRMF
jgi:ABC-type Fe3+-siderophore transport system permease subunit